MTPAESPRRAETKRQLEVRPGSDLSSSYVKRSSDPDIRKETPRSRNREWVWSVRFHGTRVFTTGPTSSCWPPVTKQGLRSRGRRHTSTCGRVEVDFSVAATKTPHHRLTRTAYRYYRLSLRGFPRKHAPSVLHYCLIAPVEVVHERLRRRGCDPVKAAWEYRRAAECCLAHQREEFAEHVAAADRDPDDIAEELVRAISGGSGPPLQSLS